MQKLKEVLTSTQAKRFYWNVCNGALGLVVLYLGDLNFAIAPVLIAVINGITKEINK